MSPLPSPLLTRPEPAPDTRAVALLLHGGAVHSRRPVDRRSASWHRARLLQRDLAPTLQPHGIAVWLLRYGVKGWNDSTSPSPVPDARWALDQARRELGLPVVLVGHSMGARTAIRVADDPAVKGVVGLAPWLPQGEPVEAVRGRDLVIGHGRHDRITSFRDSFAYVERCRSLARTAAFHDMGPLGHYLLRGSARWHAFAADAILDIVDN